jgi:hypothetical protein
MAEMTIQSCHNQLTETVVVAVVGNKMAAVGIDRMKRIVKNLVANTPDMIGRIVDRVVGRVVGNTTTLVVVAAVVGVDIVQM